MPSDLVKRLDRTVSAIQRIKGVTPPNRAERQKRMAAMQKVLDNHGVSVPVAKIAQEMRRVTRAK